MKNARISSTQNATTVIVDLDGPANERTVIVPLFNEKLFTIVADTLTITTFGPVDGPATRTDVTAEGQRIETGGRARVDYSSETGRAFKNLSQAPAFIFEAVAAFGFDKTDRA